MLYQLCLFKGNDEPKSYCCTYLCHQKAYSLAPYKVKIKTTCVYRVKIGLQVGHFPFHVYSGGRAMDRLRSLFVGKTKEDLEKSRRQLEYDLDEINIKLKQRYSVM